MTSITSSYQQLLLDALAKHKYDNTQSFQQICVRIPVEQFNIDLIAWLKGQSCYPHFYWQARSSEVRYASVGQVECFTQLSLAQQFLQNYPHCYLVGGMTFEQDCYCYLPRLLLIQDGQLLTFVLNWKTNEPFTDLERFIQQLATSIPIAKLDCQLTLNHQAYHIESWQKLVQQALAIIAQTQLNKVVLAQRKQFLSSSTINSYDLLAQAREQHPNCYYFLFAENSSQAFLGASPERLYRYQQAKLITEALAGTIASVADSILDKQHQQQLLTDSKNVHENWLVVKDICAKLSGITQGLNIGELSIRSLRYVHHLVRIIEAKLLPETNVLTALATIHPSAAVGGLPSKEASDFIHQNQNFQRGWFCGVLGVYQANQGECCVAIRSALVEGSHLTVFAGAGIVAGSQPLLEWSEVERKMASILRLFPQVNHGESYVSGSI